MNVGLHIFAEIPNGSVQFSPNRESLLLNKATTKYVEDLIEQTVDKYVERIHKKIAKAKTLKEAIEAFRSYSGIIADGATAWKGSPLKTRARYNGRYWNVYGDGTSKVTDIDTRNAYSDSALFLENAPQMIQRLHKDGLEAYRDTLPDKDKFRTVYFNGHRDPIFEQVKVVDWSVVKPFIPKRTKAKAADLTYDMYYSEGGKVRTDALPLPAGKKYLVASIKDLRGGWGDRVYDMSWLNLIPNVVVVVMNKNRHDKFIRDHAGAEDLFVWFSNYMKTTAKKITDAELEALGQSNKNTLKNLQGKTLDKRIDKLARSLVSYEKKVQVANAVASCLRHSQIDAWLTKPVTRADYMYKYPLANTTHLDHTIDYVNAIYKKEKKK